MAGGFPGWRCRPMLAELLIKMRSTSGSWRYRPILGQGELALEGRGRTGVLRTRPTVTEHQIGPTAEGKLLPAKTGASAFSNSFLAPRLGRDRRVYSIMLICIPL